MRNTRLFLFIASLIFFSLQTGCRSRVSPITGAVEMQSEREAGQRDLEKNPSDGTFKQSDKGFLGEGDGFQGGGSVKKKSGQEAEEGQTKGALPHIALFQSN